jgi:hypothetical protein
MLRQTEEMIKKSETFKSVEKDLDGIIAKINPNIKPANMLTGTSAASNLNLFKQDAMSEIALRAQSLMLGENLQWIKLLEKLQIFGLMNKWLWKLKNSLMPVRINLWSLLLQLICHYNKTLRGKL